jgi:hypothetical protein
METRRSWPGRAGPGRDKGANRQSNKQKTRNEVTLICWCGRCSRRDREKEEGELKDIDRCVGLTVLSWEATARV